MSLEKGEGIDDALGRHFAFAVRVVVRGAGCSWIQQPVVWLFYYS